MTRTKPVTLREPNGRPSRKIRDRTDTGTVDVRLKRAWKSGAITVNEFNLCLAGTITLDQLTLQPHDDPSLTATTLGTLRCRGLISDHHLAAGVEYLKLRTMLFGAAAAKARDNEATFGSGGSGNLAIDNVSDAAAETVTRKFNRGTSALTPRQRDAVLAIVVEDRVPGMLAKILTGDRPFTIGDLEEVRDLMQALEALAKVGFSARPERD